MYRMVDCGTWDDPWFAALEPDAKLLFLFLLTNRRTTAAGVFEITLRAMSFESGLSTDRLETLLGLIAEKVQWWPDLQMVWVKNFYRRQMGDSAKNPRFRDGARKAIRSLPEVIRSVVIKEYPELSDTPTIPLGKGIHTPTIPLPSPSPKESVSVSVSVSESVSESVNSRSPAVPKTPRTRYADGFEIFWTAYPRKDDKKGAAVVWNRIRPGPDLLSTMLTAIDKQGLALKEPQYRPLPTTWLNGERWNDETARAPNGTVNRENFDALGSWRKQ